MPKQPRFKWTVEIEVSPNWIEDGFDLSPERMHNIMCRELSYAHGDEIGVKILKAPKREAIKGMQGYNKGSTQRIKVVCINDKGHLVIHQGGNEVYTNETPEEFGLHLLTPPELKKIQKMQAMRRLAKQAVDAAEAELTQQELMAAALPIVEALPEAPARCLSYDQHKATGCTNPECGKV